MTRNALITGVGRRRGIGAGIAAGLAVDGWDLALSFWSPYDDRLGMEWQPDDPELLADMIQAAANEAIRSAQALMEQRLGGLAGGALGSLGLNP